jgi:transposase
VVRWLQHGGFPERKERIPRQRLLDPFLPYLRQRWSEGVTNATLLLREIQSQGYRGTSYSQLRDLVAGWRTEGPPPVAPSRVLSSVRQSAWMLVLLSDPWGLIQLSSDSTPMSVRSIAVAMYSR